MTDTIGPMPARIDQQQLAQDLVQAARADGVELVGLVAKVRQARNGGKGIDVQFNAEAIRPAGPQRTTGRRSAETTACAMRRGLYRMEVEDLRQWLVAARH